MEHVVIQDPKQTYADINNLDVLCRCRATKHPPYDKVCVGDTVYIQQKNGPITSKATVSSVVSQPYENVNSIRNLTKSSSLYNADIYWSAQTERRYGTIVWLTNHQLVHPPLYRTRKKPGDANDWIILDSNEKRQQWPHL